VVEVGLGGRLDSTNVVRPLVSGVTKIERDHMKYLGDTLESIACEKAGIAKPGAPFVIGETAPALLEVLRREARRAVARAVGPGTRAAGGGGRAVRQAPPRRHGESRALGRDGSAGDTRNAE
jgi:folylpolyglutamate synthase/dihydropteroate synthase